MNMRRFFASSSEALPTKKRVIRKVVTSLVLSAVMAAATFFYGAKHRTPTGENSAGMINPATAAPVAEIPARGLSRQRADFEKALDILADAANANPHLADYYKRVTKRIEGQATRTESASGVHAMKVRRDPPVETDKLVADVQMPVPALPGADAVPGIPTVAANDTPAATDEAAADTATIASDNDLPSPLTVGDMGFQMNPAIEHWVNYYTTNKTGRQTMTIGITRSSAYLDMARQEFRRAGVPEDLIWLAHVESVWNPRALSPAAAGGIWQFIPKTAKEYGMTVESGNDERADPMKQTRVAAAYLRDLYTLFGD